MIIIVLGLFGLVLFLVRYAVLTMESKRVHRQLRSETLMQDNPLGRLMLLNKANKEVDPETLEIRLDEAVLKETPRLERGLRTIKILAAVAPLLGLLGTVVGMIETFQSITLFGTGDPQLMIAVSEAGAVWIDGRQVDVRAVRANVERMRAENPESAVVIQADKASRTGILVQVIDQVRLAGVHNVAVAANRP